MLTQPELRHIARARLADAVALHGRRRYDAAFYICGYTVEAALKARICQTLQWDGYPETRSEFQDYTSFRTHNLEVLIRLAGMETKIVDRFSSEWSIVTRWNSEVRYHRVGGTTESESEAMIKSSRILSRAL